MSMASCPTTVSDEDVNVNGSLCLPTENAIPEMPADYGDPLARIWESLAEAIRRDAEMLKVGHLSCQGAVHEPILAPGFNKGISVKRGKVNSCDDVSHTVSNVEIANEFEVESTSVSRPKRGRGRPRKDDSSRDGCKRLC